MGWDFYDLEQFGEGKNIFLSDATGTLVILKGCVERHDGDVWQLEHEDRQSFKEVGRMFDAVVAV